MLGMLVVAYWFLVLFLNIVPVIGVLLASLAIPGLSVGLMQAARNVERASRSASKPCTAACVKTPAR